jgi:DNA/RNA non-specific endonuclease
MACGRIDYTQFQALIADGGDPARLASALSDAGAADYRAHTDHVELVEVDLGTLTYLFDIAQQRLVGVYGTSAPTSAPRSHARIKGHPSPNRPGGAQIDRGHVAAHSIGGGADINLVPQLHTLNISGEWRAFERHLQTNPGTFFAVQIEYDDDSQQPARFVYSILRNGEFISQRFVNT